MKIAVGSDHAGFIRWSIWGAMEDAIWFRLPKNNGMAKNRWTEAQIARFFNLPGGALQSRLHSQGERAGRWTRAQVGRQS